MSGTTRESLFEILQEPKALGLRPSEKLIVLYLLWRQGRNGTAWPGVDRIARDLGMDERFCRRCIDRLCAAGCVAKTSGRAGRGHSNRYAVLPEQKGANNPLLDDEKGGKQPPIVRKKRGRNSHKKGANSPLKEQGSRKQQRALTAFVPPTVAQVDEYAASIGYYRPNLGRDFTQKYSRTGWCVKSGEKMQKWELVVQAWRQRDEQEPPKGTSGRVQREPQPGDPDWYPSDEQVDAEMGWNQPEAAECQ